MKCPGCGGGDLMKRGAKQGYQRYMCRACGRYSTDKAPRFTAQVKALAIEMYMNNMGIRAIARVLNASPASILNWIRKDHQGLMLETQPAGPLMSGPDIIEMDEIYTCVQKNDSGPSSGRPIAATKAGL